MSMYRRANVSNIQEEDLEIIIGDTTCLLPRIFWQPASDVLFSLATGPGGAEGEF